MNEHALIRFSHTALGREIKSYLNQERHKFISLFPPNYQPWLKAHIYIAGGCFRSLAQGKRPKDIDFWSLVKLESIPEAIIKGIQWTAITEKAYTYKKWQLCIADTGQPEKVVGQFDFRHNMYWYDPYRVDEICSFYGTPEYLISDTLYLNEERARDWPGVLARVYKYKKRGFSVSQELVNTVRAKVPIVDRIRVTIKTKRRKTSDYSSTGSR